MHNTRSDGRGFDDGTIQAVWEKGQPSNGVNPDTYRTDKCGAWMGRTAHGNVQSTFGWEIDHINLVANGGSDALTNLQPLYWENNRRKGDTYPWNCE